MHILLVISNYISQQKDKTTDSVLPQLWKGKGSYKQVWYSLRCQLWRHERTAWAHDGDIISTDFNGLQNKDTNGENQEDEL